MKTLLLFALVLGFLGCDANAQKTWFVRADGGTRYSANALSGQCDGLGDAAYPGKGVNQHCAYNDYRFLWDDQSYGNNGWVISGGDTVILRGGPWRVGFDQGVNSSDKWCYGGNGPFACGNPVIPAGTPERHTRILGENYASCKSANQKTQVFGGFGVGSAVYLGGAKYVDVQCLELTRHSQCIQHGSPAYPGGCSSSWPLDDYASNGISTDKNTSDVLLQDLWIHGFPNRGIIGAIGGAITADSVDIAFNGAAGWDFDDGFGSPLINATWNFKNSTIEWSGCNQEYPIVHSYPAISCYSQSTGGYGDGVGTPSGIGLNVNIDHSTFRYNTQDGMDLGHLDTGTHTLSITNSTAYGNNGGQFKWGPNVQTAIFTGNTVIGNCMRLSQPMVGAPANYNQNLQDFCRANDTLSFNFRNGGTALFANNTIISYAPTTMDIGCWDGACPLSKLIFKDNIVRGYDNPSTYSLGGQAGGPGAFYYQQPVTTIRTNNLFYGMRPTSFTCPTGNAGEICADPEFVGEPANFTKEAALDSYNVKLTGSSPAISNGVSIAGLTTDQLGTLRKSPPSIGALEYALVTSSPPGTTTPVTTPPGTTTPVTTPPVTTPPVTTPPVTTPPVTTPPVTTPPATTTPVTTPPATTTPAFTYKVTPHWLKVASEGDKAVVLPAGSVVRYGAGTTWFYRYLPVDSSMAASNAIWTDPLSGVTKEMDVLLSITGPQ